MVLATHSEVVLDATEPERVFGFFGKAPRALAGREERSQLREAPKRITTTDLLLGRTWLRRCAKIRSQGAPNDQVAGPQSAPRRGG